MGEPCIGDRLSCRPQMRDGIGDVGGVPEHDRGDDEVEPGGPKLLRFGAAVGDPALLEGADDLCEGMALFALVEPGVAAPAWRTAPRCRPSATRPAVLPHPNVPE